MLHGLITERDRLAVEEAFPGIWRFYLELEDKPCTFLDLVWLFLHHADDVGIDTNPDSSHPFGPQ